jgi:leucine dehydrogenase
VTPIRTDLVFETECDVFAPCAIGGVLGEHSIGSLRCRAVAGAANNQLATVEDAGRLQDRGILYAPDFVINAGGVIHLAGRETLGWTEAQVSSALEAIGSRLETVFDVAADQGITTDQAAKRLARSRLEAGPSL